jgi:hypothetical protein
MFELIPVAIIIARFSAAPVHNNCAADVLTPSVLELKLSQMYTHTALL